MESPGNLGTVYMPFIDQSISAYVSVYRNIESDGSVVGDMPKSLSSQYGLKAQEDIDPRGIRVTNGPMR